MKITGDEKRMYVTLVSVAVTIIIYWVVLTKMYGKKHVPSHDLLNKQVIKAPIMGKNCCSWWPLSHFITFTMWGFIWPQLGWQLFFIGVLWECIEYCVKKFQTIKGEAMKFKRTRTSGGTVEYEQWWSSSSKDILFNAAGILTGIYLKKYRSK